MNGGFRRFLQVGLLACLAVFTAHAQSITSDIQAEHDPVRRSDLALNLAGSAFDNARSLYTQGDVEKGDAQLEQMTKALNECLVSLQSAHKSRFYKKAEQKVAYLQRRMNSLLEELSIQQRGWAEYTDKKLDEIHDKLLEGVMRK